MKKSKKKPPSRIRYEKNNPVVSFRTKKAWYDEFKAFLKDQGLSIGYFFRIAFEKQKANYERVKEKWYAEGYKQGDLDGYKNGYNEGYNQALNEYMISVPCYRCLKPLYIRRNSKHHKEVIEEMRGRLTHDQCPRE